MATDLNTLISNITKSLQSNTIDDLFAALEVLAAEDSPLAALRSAFDDAPEWLDRFENADVDRAGNQIADAVTDLDGARYSLRLALDCLRPLVR